MGFSLSIPLLKADENLHEIWGRATQEVIDKAGEIMDYETSKPLFQTWSNNFAERTHGKSFGAIQFHFTVAVKDIYIISIQHSVHLRLIYGFI